MSKMIQFCLGIYLVGTVTSQSLLDVGIILLLLCWLKTVVENRGVKGTARLTTLGLDYFLLAFFAVICLGYIFTIADEAPVREYIYKLTWIGHIYLLVWALQKINFTFRKLMIYFSVTFILPTIYSLLSYLNGADLITGRENLRITGLVNSATYHAHGNAMIFVFFAAVYLLNFERFEKKIKLISGICLFLLGVSIFFTFTRGVWLAIGVSSAIMLWSYRKIWAVGLVSLVIGASTFVFFVWDKFRIRVESAFSDHGRWALLKAHWDMFLNHPWLGVGYGDNIRLIPAYWEKWNVPSDYIVSHAHNQIVNILATTGVLGFLAFSGFYFGFLFMTVQLLRNKKIKSDRNKYILTFACLWVQIEFILANISDVGFEYAKIRAIIVLAWALVVVLKKDFVIVQDDPVNLTKGV